jgi:pyridoxamine 5'-phosphate oxidase
MKYFGHFLTEFRNEYNTKGEPEFVFGGDPFMHFDSWFIDAVDSKINMPNAMYLSTARRDGKPSGRIVLLTKYDQRGFIFFTNYESRKGEELKENNYACLTFFWKELYRQVRIEGVIYKLPAEESDLYFTHRPRESQIAAIASEQSKPLESREVLEKKVSDLDQAFSGKTIGRPDNWGGYILSPSEFEFWQGRAHRLHDRLKYELNNKSKWVLKRLYP